MSLPYGHSERNFASVFSGTLKRPGMHPSWHGEWGKHTFAKAANPASYFAR